jgi:hypothetical protein
VVRRFIKHSGIEKSLVPDGNYIVSSSSHLTPQHVWVSHVHSTRAWKSLRLLVLLENSCRVPFRWSTAIVWRVSTFLTCIVPAGNGSGGGFPLRFRRILSRGLLFCNADSQSARALNVVRCCKEGSRCLCFRWAKRFLLLLSSSTFCSAFDCKALFMTAASSLL